MAFFVVFMSHPNHTAWSEHLKAHMAYIRSLEKRGTLRASGKVVDAKVTTACLILTAQDRTELDSIIAKDPFSSVGVIENLRISEWDPFIGIFAAESSGNAPE